MKTHRRAIGALVKSHGQCVEAVAVVSLIFPYKEFKGGRNGSASYGSFKPTPWRDQTPGADAARG